MVGSAELNSLGVNGVLREAKHLWSFVEKHLAQFKRGTGSQCRGSGRGARSSVLPATPRTEGELQRGVQVCTRAFGSDQRVQDASLQPAGKPSVATADGVPSIRSSRI